MEKVAFFIDYGYLVKILEKQFDKANIDLEKFCQVMTDQIITSHSERLRTYFYYCMPLVRKGNKQDEIRYSRADKFIKKIQRLNRFEVKLGRLQYTDGKFKQKKVDILMSLDIVDMAFEEYAKKLVIIAGDSDFVPAIQKAKNHGATTILYYHPSSIHEEILNCADEIREIDEHLINSSKLKRKI